MTGYMVPPTGEMIPDTQKMFPEPGTPVHRLSGDEARTMLGELGMPVRKTVCGEGVHVDSGSRCMLLRCTLHSTSCGSFTAWALMTKLERLGRHFHEFGAVTTLRMDRTYRTADCSLNAYRGYADCGNSGFFEFGCECGYSGETFCATAIEPALLSGDEVRRVLSAIMSAIDPHGDIARDADARCRKALEDSMYRVSREGSWAEGGWHDDLLATFARKENRLVETFNSSDWNQGIDLDPAVRAEIFDYLRSHTGKEEPGNGR